MAKTEADPFAASRAFADKAERALEQQRRALVPQFIQIDEKAADNPADIAMCERVVTAAKTDFGEFENLITFPEVRRLFDRGALHFRQPTTTAKRKKK